MSPMVRIVILVIVDLFFVTGLGVLLFVAQTPPLTPILGCVALIAYTSFSIFQIWSKANKPAG